MPALAHSRSHRWARTWGSPPLRCCTGRKTAPVCPAVSGIMPAAGLRIAPYGPGCRCRTPPSSLRPLGLPMHPDSASPASPRNAGSKKDTPDAMCAPICSCSSVESSSLAYLSSKIFFVVIYDCKKIRKPAELMLRRFFWSSCKADLIYSVSLILVAI